MIENIPSILLLDCTNVLKSRLVRQGFDVESGETGFATGTRRLPKQIYEHNIIIYNPSTIAARPDGVPGYIQINQIQDATPQFRLSEIHSHMERGTILLAFVKELVSDDQSAVRRAYSWIPGAPSPDSTSDTKVESHVKEDNLNFLSPIISPHFLKKPVRQKIPQAFLSRNYYVNDLYTNLNQDTLGVMVEIGQGELILLPDCEDNEEIINVFLRRVVPKMFKSDSGGRTSLIEIFQSPAEEKNTINLDENKKKAAFIEAEEEKLLGKLHTATAKKIQTLSKDDSAQQILKYYDLATGQPDVSLFYLYKIIDYLGKKFGGKKKAAMKLSVTGEWNYIGEVANSSYGDMRHAPEPGEPIKEWSDEEIEKCFEYCRKTIFAYFETLFVKS